MAPVDATNIAIVGGYDASEYVSDAVMFDIDKVTCKKIIERDPAITFYAFSNQTVVAKDSTLISLVKS